MGGVTIERGTVQGARPYRARKPRSPLARRTPTLLRAYCDGSGTGKPCARSAVVVDEGAAGLAGVEREPGGGERRRRGERDRAARAPAEEEARRSERCDPEPGGPQEQLGPLLVLVDEALRDDARHPLLLAVAEL